MSQFRCPLLAGRRLPTWPGESGPPRAQSLWAAYVMGLFVPWDVNRPPDVSWEAFQRWESAAKRPEAPYIERNRWRMVQRLKLTARHDDHVQRSELTLRPFGGMECRPSWEQGVWLAGMGTLSPPPRGEAGLDARLSSGSGCCRR